MTDGISGVDSTAPTEQIVATGNNTLDSLLWGRRWVSDAGASTTTLSFSFPDANSQFNTGAGGYPSDGDQEPFTGLTAVSATAQTLFRDILQGLENFSNLQFVEVDDSGDSAGTIRLANTGIQDENAVAWAYLPGAYQAAGDIWILSANHSEADIDYTHTLLHELGHALGLKHSFEAEGGFPAIDSSLEGVDYTVMSYTVSARFPNATWQDLWPQTYMYADILALQYLYGVDTVTTAGADSYAYSQDERHFLTIWDYSGTDTLSVSGSRDVKLDLTPGSWSNVGTTIEYWDGTSFSYDSNTVFITPDTVIENATGAGGNDTLVGNDANNRLRGNDGSDTIMGGSGADVLVGGTGNDVGLGGTGDDTLWAGGGDQGADLMAGGAGDDVIAGGGGNDLLVGGGLDDAANTNFAAATSTDSAEDDGSDVLYGGDGDDTLLGGGWKDDVSDDGQYSDGEAVTTGLGQDGLWAGGGNDLIIAAAGDDNLGGGAGDDTIDGGAGDDIVYGGSDAGDTGTNDVIRGGEGNDTVFAGAGNDSLNGDEGNDNLFSGGGSDTVNGGSGADTLWGGGGDDRFTGGAGADLFVFAGGHGDDTVTDFNVAEDVLRLSGTTTDFTDADSVLAASSIVQGNLVIDLGGGDSLTLVGLQLSDISSINLILED